MQRLLSSAGAGKLLGVSAQRVRALRKCGSLPVGAQTESGVYLFRHRDVERLVRQRRRTQGTSRRFTVVGVDSETVPQ